MTEHSENSVSHIAKKKAKRTEIIPLRPHEHPEALDAAPNPFADTCRNSRGWGPTPSQKALNAASVVAEFAETGGEGFEQFFSRKHNVRPAPAVEEEPPIPPPPAEQEDERIPPIPPLADPLPQVMNTFGGFSQSEYENNLRQLQEPAPS